MVALLYEFFPAKLRLILPYLMMSLFKWIYLLFDLKGVPIEILFYHAVNLIVLEDLCPLEMRESKVFCTGGRHIRRDSFSEVDKI